MANVLNRQDIEKRIEEFYSHVQDITELNVAPSSIYPNKINLDKIRVGKISAYADFRIGVGICVDEEDDIDEDVLYDYELCNAWAMSISEGLEILPSEVFINANGGEVIFEWTPQKPIYISSFEEYCKLYQSFADFLEGSFLVDSSPSPDDVEICFSSLHMPIFSEDIKSDDEDPAIDKTFTESNFSSMRTIICTHDRIVSYFPIQGTWLGRCPIYC